ncbi:MAG: alpha/beta hydrolase [Moraxellaceae bacterium]
MSWQGNVLNRVLRRTMKPMMFSSRPTRARMGISAWALEASAALMPVPAVKITPARGILRGEWVEPLENPSSTVILYLHGGAYIAGSARTHRPLTAELARSSGARVLALDYRQAPDHAWPAWLDDAMGAYQHLIKNGHRPQDIVLAGDSAGGNLVLVTLLRLRELGLPLPAGAICLSPWTDLACGYQSHRLNAKHEAMLKPEALRNLGLHHIGKRDPKDPLISPAYADLKDLPPLMVHVGSKEILLDDARAIKRNAKRAGVHLHYREWTDMPHVFPLFHGILPEGRKAISQMSNFVKDVTS